MQAPLWMTSACASTKGSAKPVTTVHEVRKRPKSTADEESAAKSSVPQRENREFGNGAKTNIKANG